jgi:amino acid transporter
MSVLVSVIGGFILLYSITASIQDGTEQGLAALLATDTALPPAQVFLDALGSTKLAQLLLFIVCVAQYFCGMASVTANSRMSYAFSRDNALPGSAIWSKVNPRTGTPTNSIWFCVFWSIVLASPVLFNTTAYLAVTSIAVIGLYIAYVVPVFLRLVNPEFAVGPWNLGRWSKPIGWTAVAWVAFICVLFVLPPVSPVDVNTFNYAPIAVLAVLAFATLTWFAGGRHHFMHGIKDLHHTEALDEIFEEQGHAQAREQILAEDE